MCINDATYTYNYNIKQQYANTPRAEPGHASEMTRPAFYGSNRDIHPVDFLHRLDEYFAIKQLYVGEKIIVVGDCLKSAALSWFSTIRFQLSDYDDFRKAFIEEYWSREIQIQIWSQCLSITQIPQNTNFRNTLLLELPNYVTSKYLTYQNRKLLNTLQNITLGI